MANILYTDQLIEKEVKVSCPIAEASSTPPVIEAELIQSPSKRDAYPQLTSPDGMVPEVKDELVKQTKEIKKLMVESSSQLHSLDTRLFKLAEDLNSLYKR